MPSKKPRKTCALFVCTHSPPALNVCAPATIEKLFLTWNRFTSSSMLGPRKNGLPKRNVVPKPIAVSAGTDDVTALRGRFSREYVTCSSFNLFVVTVLNRLTFSTLIFDGPSVPLAELPYVATSNVWFVFLE